MLMTVHSDYQNMDMLENLWHKEKKDAKGIISHCKNDLVHRKISNFH